MIQLPTERSVVDNYNPKLLIIMGRPKQGKSSFVAAIDDNLIIDLEDGYRALSVMKVQARSMKDLQEIKSAIIAKGKELHKAPYRFITIDNAPVNIFITAVDFGGIFVKVPIPFIIKTNPTYKRTAPNIIIPP